MSLKKPTSLASTPPTGAVGVPKPLQTLFSTKKEDWTQDLYRALDPKTPTQATGLDEGFSKKPKNKIVINKETLSGGCITSALNTPVMSNTPELINTPEIMSPIQTMLFPENQLGVEQVTELTVPVVQYPVEDSNPISVPVDDFIFNMPDSIPSVWGELNNTNQGPFATDSNQCIDPRMAEGIQFTVDEAMEQILFNNMPENSNVEDVAPFSPVGNFDAASLNTSTAPQGDLLDWLFNKTVVAEDAEVEPHYSPMDLETTEDEEEYIPRFLIQTKASVKEEIPSTITSQFVEPTPSTSSVFNQPAPVQIKVEVIQKKTRGRPPKEGPRHITPKPTPANKDRRTDTDHIYMGVVHDNKDDQRYRRMRDLNNDASKRCRQNRKTKFTVLEMEKDQLIVKNSELKFKVKKMEEIVAALKKKFISDIANPVKSEAPTNAAPPAEVPSFVATQQDETFNIAVPQDVVFDEAPIFMCQPQGATNYPDLFEVEWTGFE